MQCNSAGSEWYSSEIYCTSHYRSVAFFEFLPNLHLIRNENIKFLSPFVDVIVVLHACQRFIVKGS